MQRTKPNKIIHISQPEDSPRWHILTYIPDAPGATATKVIDAFNRSENAELELFAPKYSVPTSRHGKIHFRALPLTFFYVFLRGSLSLIKRLCNARRGFAFLLDRAGASRYAVISDSAMQQFKTIARAYSNTLPFFSPTDIDLAAGDLVEVISGDFPGLTGHFLPTPRSKSGSIILQVDQGLATAAFNIRADQIRILKFAPGSGREYDQIDHFISKILTALHLYHSGQALPRSSSAALSVFVSRMESVSLENRKLRPKLDAILMGSYHILGRAEEETACQRRLKKELDKVTNPWTLALINLIIAVTSSDRLLFLKSYEAISQQEPSSKVQQLIAHSYQLHKPLFAV